MEPAMSLNKVIEAVTQRIARRSAKSRRRYLDHIRAAIDPKPRRRHLPCANLAHGFAACGAGDEGASFLGTLA